MSAQPERLNAAPPASTGRPSCRKAPEITWGEIAARAPQMAHTMGRFLDQLAVSSRPSTVGAYSLALRFFAGRVTAADPAYVRVASIQRRHLEDYKRWLADRPGKKTPTLSTTTIRHSLGLLRTFFERIIDWDYDDAPAKVPIFPGDFPQLDEPLPKFLDDPTAAKFMAGLATDPNPRRRLMVELLARTGMRAGNWPRFATTRWSGSATRSGCASQSANSTTTATSRCTRSWSN